MNDMSAVIVPKSDQINADDLLAGPVTISISSVEIRPGTEQPVSIRFEGDNGKPWKPCKSMSRVLVALWGPDANAYVGRALTLYNDPKVLWGGMAVGGIRISHMSHISERSTLALTATKGKRTPFVVQPLKAAAPKPAPVAEAPAGVGGVTFDITSGSAMLKSISAHLGTCTTPEQVHEVARHKDVVHALSIWPQAGKDKLNAMIKAAIDRTSSAVPDFVDEDDFPGVVTPREGIADLASEIP